MRNYNSFNEMAVANMNQPDLKSDMSVFEVQTLNAPYKSVKDKGIKVDFHVEDWYDGRVEDYYQGDKDEHGQPVANPNIVDSVAEKRSYQQGIVQDGSKFFGKIPAKLAGQLGSGYVACDGGTHLMVFPNREALETHVASQGGNLSAYTELPSRWEDWANMG